MKIHGLHLSGLQTTIMMKALTTGLETMLISSEFFWLETVLGPIFVYNMVARAGVEDLAGMKILGACLIHPYFGRKGGDVDHYWLFACPTTSGFNDPRINPAVDARLASIGCSRVLICVAEKDGLKERGLFFYETLKKSGWDGQVHIVETEGEEHVFHLFNPDCEKAVVLLKRLASFFK